MSSVATDQPGQPRETAERLEWSVWPARQRPVLSVVVGLICVLAVWGAEVGFGSVWYGAIAAVVLLRATSAHFFPISYVLNGEGVRVDGFLFWSRRKWEDFRCAFDQGDALLLSGYTDPERFFPPAGFANYLSQQRFWRTASILKLPDDAWPVRRYVGARLPVQQWSEVRERIAERAQTCCRRK